MTIARDLLWGALALGTVTGMRSMLAPTLVSRALAEHPHIDQMGEPARTLAMPRTRHLLTPLAASELIGDKLPFAPDRTISASMAVRAVSGGLTAAALASARRQPILLPALLGAVAACASASIGLRLRKRYGRSGALANAALGSLEDCLAVTIGNAGLRRAIGKS
ncbi:putative membrane protein [Pseudomonas duriflava]|uniref:Putative membrane protein n=1 Tax=Pseudomonas duriflava TaxID=459528 RepID=A0A562QFT7_9PSED|nr:DUF4126 family protein [Pseudomonas duriflava]TWI55030.1 putative membrane protein [Pseudomonas duriflava]